MNLRLVFSCVMFFSASACMYPGMDKQEPFGESVNAVMSAQVLDPASTERNGSTPVSGLDGERAGAALTRLRQAQTQDNGGVAPVVVKIGQ